MDMSGQPDVALAATSTSSKSFIPIAGLENSQNLSSEQHIKGIVTLIWPYSSSTRRAALLLAEQDFRLRNQKGQVRIQFRGAAARAVAVSGISIGDLLEFSLDGVYWTDETGHVKTPGRSVDGELVYRKRIKLEIFREQTSIANIDVLEVESPPKSSSVSPAGGPLGIKATPTRTVASDTWSSPVFLHSTPESASSPVDAANDLFADLEDFPEGREKKRQRIWKPSHGWRYIDTSKSRKEDDTPSSSFEPLSPRANLASASTPSRASLKPAKSTLLEGAPSPMPPPKLWPVRGAADEPIMTPPRPTLRPITSPGLPIVSPFVASSQSSYFMQPHVSAPTPLENLTQISDHLESPTAQRFRSQASEPEPASSADVFGPPDSNQDTAKQSIGLLMTEVSRSREVSLGPNEESNLHQGPPTQNTEVLGGTEATVRLPTSEESNDQRHEKNQLEKAVLPLVPSVVLDNVQASVTTARDTTVTDNNSTNVAFQDPRAESGQLHGNAAVPTPGQLTIEPHTSRKELLFEDVFVFSPTLPNELSQLQDLSSVDKAQCNLADDKSPTFSTFGQQSHETGLLPTPDASQTQTSEVFPSSPPIQETVQDLQMPALMTPQPSNLRLDDTVDTELEKDKQPDDVADHPTRRRRSLRLSNSHSKVPEVISPWFEPRRSRPRQQKPTETGTNAGVTGGTTSEPIVSDKAQLESALPENDQLILTPNVNRVSETALNGFRTRLSYYTPLRDIYQHLNHPHENGRSLDVLSVVVSQHSKPSKSKAGPKDYYVTFSISDPSIFPEDVQVRVFRPKSSALPTPNTGDIIILRAVDVKGHQRKPMLVSQQWSSGWCRWSSYENEAFGDGHQQPDNQFIEVGEEEKAIANDLKSWWKTLPRAEQVIET